jgi:hypothetical protein
MALVVGSEVVARYPDGLAAGCLALARPAGAPLLGVTLARDAEGEWVLEDGRLFPTCATVDVRRSRPSAAHWVPVAWICASPRRLSIRKERPICSEALRGDGCCRTAPTHD